MFEDALFATNRRRTPQQRWAALMSFASQVAFVTVLVGLPLFFTEALPLSIRVTEMPTVPRSAEPPPTEPAQPTHPRPGSQSEVVNDQVIFIGIPKHPAIHVTDSRPPVPPCVVGCVENSTNTDPTATSHLMENILGKGPAISGPPPELEKSKPLLLSHLDEGLLIRKIAPPYPPLAIAARQQGTVSLHAIIGRDGTIQQLQVISGPSLLVNAARDAVLQWRYKPYKLNGEPVEVDTTITVNFKLGG